MADRAANREGVATRLLVFPRSVLLVAVVAAGIPALLVWVARERFGGGSPFHGVAGPADWSGDRIRSSLTDRLTDQMIADIVIRLALVVAWVAVAVLVLTVIAEVVHMLRHDGLALPDVRGLGVSQRTARVIASGLLVIVPLLTSPAAVIADGSTELVPDRVVAARAADAPHASVVRSADSRDSSDPMAARRRGPSAARVGEVETPPIPVVATGRYVVQSGDSVFGIAERIAGPDSASVAAFAEQLVDLNLGRHMPDGRHFDNAAFIDVGWVLELPVRSDPASDPGAATAELAASDVHVVQQGESLWSIADEELGDPSRWPRGLRGEHRPHVRRWFEPGRPRPDPARMGSRPPCRRPGGRGTVDRHRRHDGRAGDRRRRNTTRRGSRRARCPSGTWILSTRRASPMPTHRSASPLTPRAGATTSGRRRMPHRWTIPPPAAKRRVADEAVTADDGAEGGADETVAAIDPAVARSGAEVSGGTDSHRDQDDDSNAPAPLVFGSAAMLSTGVLTLLAVRRRHQLRRSRPRATLPEPAGRPAATERALRAVGAGERFVRVETGVRAAAAPLVDHGQRVLACTVATDGSLSCWRPARSTTGAVGGGRRHVAARCVDPTRAARRGRRRRRRPESDARSTRNRRAPPGRVRRPGGDRGDRDRRTRCTCRFDRGRPRRNAGRFGARGGDHARRGRCTRRGVPRPPALHPGP